VTAIELLDNLR